MVCIGVMRRAGRRSVCSSGCRGGIRRRRTASRASAVTAVLLTVGALGIVGTSEVAVAESVTATIKVGLNPTEVAANPAGTDAYVTNLQDASVSVIDLSTNTVNATIPVGSYPQGVVVNPAGTDAFVANEYSDSVSVIDLSTNTVTATIPVGVAPIGVAVNPAGTDAYVTNTSADTVSVVNLSTKTVTATIPVLSEPGAVAVNPAGTYAYVTDIGDDAVSVVDLSTDTVTATIPVGAAPYGLAINRAGTDAYVTNTFNNTVSVIDLSTNTVTTTFPVGRHPYGVVVNPAGTEAYVTENGDDAVSVIDLSSDTVAATIPMAGGVQGLAANPTGTDAYVTNPYDDTMSVLALTPPAPGVPGRPTALDGDHQATVSVTATTSGGTPTFYTVTAADATTAGHGGQTCAVHELAGACILTGLINGDTYTFTATATDAVGTSAASPASNPVTPASPADLAVTLNGPARAVDGTAFTEKVTVTDKGPATATAVVTTVLIPAGLTVTAAPGASVHSGTLDWAAPSLVAGKSVVYPVTFNVGAHTDGPVTLGAVTEDDGYDPNLANNAAITTIQLSLTAP
jgi:YVTN family beta-propeller protein